MKTILVIAAGAGLLALGLALGYWLRSGTGADQAAADVAAVQEREVLYWYDPMVPDQHFDTPGPSPFMDMDLVPKYADEGSTPGTVRIDPGTVQNLGVRTATVERGSLSTDLVVPGTLDWNRRAAWQVSARTGGVIQRLHVRAPFEPVRAGQPLVDLIAPEWNAAIAEYRSLAAAESAQARALRNTARERLRSLGMEEAQIRALGNAPAAAPTVTLRAPADGVVSTVEVREGQQVSAGTPLMTVNGLDTIWVQAAVPQAQSASVTVGTPVEATISAVPGRTFTGVVESLLPTVDAATRTQTARIVLDNPGHRLAPGMFAEVRFAGAAGAAHPLVPADAVIAAGSEARVIVADGDGRFRAVPVRTGRSAGGMTEVLSGLDGGEAVVVSGQFLIDSEASLSGALERLRHDADPAAPATEPAEPDPHAHHHGAGKTGPEQDP